MRNACLASNAKSGPLMYLRYNLKSHNAKEAIDVKKSSKPFGKIRLNVIQTNISSKHKVISVSVMNGYMQKAMNCVSFPAQAEHGITN